MITIKLAISDEYAESKVLSVNYEVFDSKTLENRVLFREEETILKTFYVFNEPLDETKEYYARASLKLDTGWTEPSTVKAFTPYDNISIELDPILPSIIKTTEVRIVNSDINNHRRNKVEIELADFLTHENITHQFSSFVLEDIVGNTIASLVETSANKTTCVFTFSGEGLLEPNTIYRVKASMKGSNEDTSGWSTVTFITGS